MSNINNKVEVQVLDDLHYLKNGKRCKKVWGHGINDADYEVQPRSGNGKHVYIVTGKQIGRAHV